MVAVSSRPESACARSMSGMAASSPAVPEQLLRLAMLQVLRAAALWNRTEANLRALGDVATGRL